MIKQIYFGLFDVLIKGKLNKKPNTSYLSDLVEFSKDNNLELYLITGLDSKISETIIEENQLLAYFKKENIIDVAEKYYDSLNEIDKELKLKAKEQNPNYSDEYYKVFYFNEIFKGKKEEVLFIGHDIWTDVYYLHKYSNINTVILKDTLSNNHAPNLIEIKDLNVVDSSFEEIKEYIVNPKEFKYSYLNSYAEKLLYKEIFGSSLFNSKLSIGKIFDKSKNKEKWKCMNIKKIKAIKTIDSRGVPTIKTFVYTNNSVAFAMVPSGTSSGKREALELRDGGKAFGGKDVTKAINNINKKISKELSGEFVLDQNRIDRLMLELDGTENKSKLGANAILSVSLACARAASQELGISLYTYLSRLNNNSSLRMPTPLLNIINGGKHAGTDLAFQEFQIIPTEKTISKNMQVSCEIYQILKEIIKNKYGASATNVGFEGGFAPNIIDPRDAFDLLENAIKKSGYKVSIGIDAAASEFYEKGKYLVNNKKYSSLELSDYYLELLKEYNITSVEDPFSEDDKKPWVDFTKKLNRKIMVIGDDLLVTNPKIIKEGIKKKYCNSLLLKVNQIGTLTESLEAFNLAKKANWKVVVSHRSGETEDVFISDLAYGLGSDYVKFGAPSRSERTAKYNRLIEIEEGIF